MTEEKFTYYMTGRNIDTTDVKEVKDFSKSDKVLEVKNLSAKGFEHVSFDLHAGEILGIARTAWFRPHRTQSCFIWNA